MPDFSFLGEHEENKKRDESALQNESVERTNTANDQIVNRAGITGRCGYLGSGFRTGDVCDAALEAADLLLYTAGGGAQDTPILRPLGRELRGAKPKGVPGGNEDQDHQQNENERANGAGNAEALQEFHGGIQEISDEDGKQQGDDDTRGVIKKQQDDRRSNQPHAEV